MSEFGHFGVIGNGICIDSWGAGPFTIKVGKRDVRFEDSDRFGPLLLTKNDMPAEKQPGERSHFWKPYNRWRKQGRRVAEDGKTCIVDPPRPTLVIMVGRRRMLIEEGDEDGEIIQVAAEERSG